MLAEYTIPRCLPTHQFGAQDSLLTAAQWPQFTSNYYEVTLL